MHAANRRARPPQRHDIACPEKRCQSGRRQGGDAMKLRRRRFLQLMGAAAAYAGAPRIGRAETYPARPVHMVVGQASGSSSDITARLIGQFLTERLGQQFVVEDRPGAGGNIATEAVM